MVVKTNDKEQLRKSFSDESVRKVFQSLEDFTFGITYHTDQHSERNNPFLELQIESGLTDPGRLREIYHAFFSVLILADNKITY